MSGAQNDLISSTGRAAAGYTREGSSFFVEIARRLVAVANPPTEGPHGERRALERMDDQTPGTFREAQPTALEPAREEDGLLHRRPESVYAVASRP